jgi:hypothetical protein
MYSVEYDVYKRHNHLSKVIQTITFDHVDAYLTTLKDGGLKHGDRLDVQGAVQVIFKKTLKEQKDYLRVIGKA